jgi:hypothetical protein
MALPHKPLTHLKVKLTLLDRCDACQAQAYVTVIVNETDLLFCNHHYNKHKTMLDKYVVIKSIVEEY